MFVVPVQWACVRLDEAEHAEKLKHHEKYLMKLILYKC